MPGSPAVLSSRVEATSLVKTENCVARRQQYPAPLDDVWSSRMFPGQSYAL